MLLSPLRVAGNFSSRHFKISTLHQVHFVRRKETRRNKMEHDDYEMEEKCKRKIRMIR
jgi:hypothetical protein